MTFTFQLLSFKKGKCNFKWKYTKCDGCFTYHIKILDFFSLVFQKEMKVSILYLVFL